MRFTVLVDVSLAIRLNDSDSMISADNYLYLLRRQLDELIL